MKNYTNNYVFKALDSYHYDLEETIEALNYALSYDDKNTMALTLMGRVHAEKLYNYVDAITYYKEALAVNINAFEVYSNYINVLLWNEDVNEAEDFIDFALSIKGSDKAMLYLKKVILYEQLKEYKKALSFIKLAIEYTFNADFMETVNVQKERIKAKVAKKKKSKITKKGKKTEKVKNNITTQIDCVILSNICIVIMKKNAESGKIAKRNPHYNKEYSEVIKKFIHNVKISSKSCCVFLYSTIV